MFTGRATEMSRFREAILARKSLLVYGPAGAGKTALLKETLSSLPTAVRTNCLVCGSCENPRSVWRNLICSLSEVADPAVLSRVERECGPSGSLARWLDKQSSLRLRGIVRRATRAKAYCVFLDSNAPLPAGVYRLLQEWVWSGSTPVFLLTRGSTEEEIGRVARLYWHGGLQLELSPMRQEDLMVIVDYSLKHFRLTELSDEEFRDFLLRKCAGLPGRIVQLCELASQSVYHYNGCLKLHTLAVDFQMQIQSEPQPLVRASHNG